MKQLTIDSRIAACFSILSASLFAGYAQETIPALLDSRALASEYNSVVVDYLCSEGADRLTPDDRKQALDQLVSALREKIMVTPEEQVEVGLGVAIGLILGQAGGALGEAGDGVAGQYAGEWNGWIVSAFDLLDAGYAGDAAEFFRFGLKHAPFGGMKARCTEGLAAASPEEAYDLLMNSLSAPDTKILNSALCLLGRLAAGYTLDEEQKDAAIEALVQRTGGLVHATTIRAAICGLDASGDLRAIDALAKFKSGVIHDKTARHAALRSLLLTFDDQSVIDVLKSMIKGGFFTMSDAADEFFAATLLIEAGDDAGFAWAESKLLPKKKGFFAPKDTGPDYRSAIIEVLTAAGGEKGVELLRKAASSYRDDDVLKRQMAVCLLEMGDNSQIEFVRSTLQNIVWDLTSVRAVAALAGHKDYSGLNAIRVLIQQAAPEIEEGDRPISGPDEIAPGDAANIARFRQVRIRTAEALGRINVQACVPLLEMLLEDGEREVRIAAAHALMSMTNPSALDGLAAAMAADYNMDSDAELNHEMCAGIVRAVDSRFAGYPKAKEIINGAASSPYASVRLMALMAAETIK